MTARAHWDDVWATSDATQLSWHQDVPEVSFELVAAAGLELPDPLVDIGGGVSPLVMGLARRGFRDLTVVDVAAPALHRLGLDLEAAFGGHEVALVCCDILEWRPTRRYSLWHDRAVNHFLVEAADRRTYAETLTDAVMTGGYAILASFAPDGPDHCSGLPVHRDDPDRLAGTFAPAFALCSVTRELHRTPWNTTQAFQYLLLRRR